jgi:hypothetical protein
MRKHNQQGSLLLPLVVLVVFFVATLGFAVWAFMSRQDYKNKSDAKVTTAVQKAIIAEDAKKDTAFAEAEKSPFKTYTGPATYGTISFKYPKTWSAYVSELASSSNSVVNGYYSPNFVPDVQSNTLFALRLQVVNTDYTTVLKTFDASTKAGTTTVSAYHAPKVPSVLGSYITGVIDAGNKKSGTLVLLPLRDKTIRIWTEGSDFNNDFNNTVLASLSFIP